MKCLFVLSEYLPGLCKNTTQEVEEEGRMFVWVCSCTEYCRKSWCKKKYLETTSCYIDYCTCTAGYILESEYLNFSTDVTIVCFLTAQKTMKSLCRFNVLTLVSELCRLSSTIRFRLYSLQWVSCCQFCVIFSSAVVL